MAITLNASIPPPVDLQAKNPLRDTNGCRDRYNQIFWISFKDADGKDISVFEREIGKYQSGLTNFAASYAINNLNAITGRLVYMYARGDALSDLAKRFDSDYLLYAINLKDIYNEITYGSNSEGLAEKGVYDCYRWDRLSFLAFLLLLVPDREAVKSWLSFFREDTAQRTANPDRQSYYLSALIKAFSADWPLLNNKHTLPKRSRPGERLEVMQALFRALALPTPQARSQGMAEYMGKWNRMMKPYGWKPKRVFYPLREDGRQADLSFNSDRLFVEFALEAALAVCAYDLDDKAFRDHPYYPRDLVDHYRSHIRHTRDVWRAVGVGADVKIEAPPAPQKLDLNKSKSKGLARWVELVSDGDPDAVGAVVEQVGKLRKVKEVFELACALAENGAGLCVDIKDDATLASQIDALLERRQLGELALADDMPAAGAGRCSALLLALDRWLADKPYRLCALDGDGDSREGVLVPRAHEAEFEQLTQTLGMATAEPREAYKN